MRIVIAASKIARLPRTMSLMREGSTREELVDPVVIGCGGPVATIGRMVLEGVVEFMVRVGER